MVRELLLPEKSSIAKRWWREKAFERNKKTDQEQKTSKCKKTSNSETKRVYSKPSSMRWGACNAAILFYSLIYSLCVLFEKRETERWFLLIRYKWRRKRRRRMKTNEDNGYMTSKQEEWAKPRVSKNSNYESASKRTGLCERLVRKRLTLFCSPPELLINTENLNFSP